MKSKAANEYIISYEQFIELIQHFSGNEIFWEYEDQNAIYHLKDNFSRKIVTLTPPILFHAPSTIAETVEPYPDEYLLILIQAGHAALGHFEEGALLNHKVIRRYMVRAKQGKAQYNYLKTKGKSKAGSRVRLAQTIDFFEEINDKIQEWEIIDRVKYIYYSASIPLWNLMFESKVQCPFLKEDSRLQKIPSNINTPSFEELIRMHEYLSQATLSIVEEELFENLILPFQLG